MNKTDYTQLFEKLLLSMGTIPKFPFDLLHPDIEKVLKNKTWPHSSRGMIYASQPNRRIEFLTEGDYATVPMWDISGTGATRTEVETAIETKINNYCMEMIQCEQEYGFPSTKKNRIIVNRGSQVYIDPNGGYYGWDSIGFIILRVIK